MEDRKQLQEYGLHNQRFLEKQEELTKQMQLVVEQLAEMKVAVDMLLKEERVRQRAAQKEAFVKEGMKRAFPEGGMDWAMRRERKALAQMWEEENKE